jgi:dCMP deaminase
MSDRPSMLDVYMTFAFTVAARSTCKRYGTGAVIVSSDLRSVYSIGYNGSPHGQSHSCNGETGNCQCIHSEINALLKVTQKDPDKIMFCTHSPCPTCARYMIQSGFSKLYYYHQYRLLEGLYMLSDAGIIPVQHWSIVRLSFGDIS